MGSRSGGMNAVYLLGLER